MLRLKSSVYLRYAVVEALSLPGICCGMGDHDISVDGDGQDVEDGHSQQPISQQGEQLKK